MEAITATPLLWKCYLQPLCHGEALPETTFFMGRLPGSVSNHVLVEAIPATPLCKCYLQPLSYESVTCNLLVMEVLPATSFFHMEALPATSLSPIVLSDRR